MAQQPESISLLDILSFVVRWRRIWIPSMLVCAIAVGIYAFVAPPLYRSFAIVKGIEANSGGLGSLLASKLAGLGSVGNFAPALGEIRGDFYLLVLRERTMTEKVINKFDIRSRLDLNDAAIEDVIDAWHSRSYFKFEASTNTVKIQVDDEDPEFAKQVVEFYVDELDARIRETQSSKARKEREFAGNRLEEERLTLFAFEDSMAQFQRISGIFDLEEQAKATVQAAAAIQAERLLARADLELKKKLFSTDNPEISLSKMKLAGLDSSMTYFATDNPDTFERDFLLKFDSASENGKTYLRLYRDIELHSILLTLLTQQYEQAKMEEARNTPTLAVIEPAGIGSKRVSPKRAMLIGLGGALGLIFGLIGGGLKGAVMALNKPDHPDHERMLKLKRSWSGR